MPLLKQSLTLQTGVYLHLSMFAVYIAPIHVSSLYVKALEVVHRQVTLGSHVREGREHVATVSPTRTRWVSQE